jgi:hypothetical protein
MSRLGMNLLRRNESENLSFFQNFRYARGSEREIVAITRELNFQVFVFKKGKLVDTTSDPAIHNIAAPHQTSLGLIGNGAFGI